MKAAAPEARRGTFDMARADATPYAASMHRFAYGEIMPGLEAIAMPGHTPGHTGYMLTSAARASADLGRRVPRPRGAGGPAGRRHRASTPTRRRPSAPGVPRWSAPSTEDLLVTGMHMSFPGFASHQPAPATPTSCSRRYGAAWPPPRPVTTAAVSATSRPVVAGSLHGCGSASWRTAFAASCVPAWRSVHEAACTCRGRHGQEVSPRVSARGG